MGLILDTGILARLEKDRTALDLSRYHARFGEGFISVATCSELLVGVHFANSEQRRFRRSAFVEAVFQLFRPLPFDLEAARVHAQLVSALPKRVILGALDLVIGATAIRFGYPVLTTNPVDFNRIPGCVVEAA